MWVNVPALLSPLAREDPTEIPALLQPMCTSQTPRQHGQRTASRRDRRGEPQSPRRDQDQQHPQSSHKMPRPACCCKFTDQTLWPGLWGEGSAGEREAASRVGRERPRRGEDALLSSHREGESRAAWPWRHGRPEVATSLPAALRRGGRWSLRDRRRPGHGGTGPCPPAGATGALGPPQARTPRPSHRGPMDCRAHRLPAPHLGPL